MAFEIGSRNYIPDFKSYTLYVNYLQTARFSIFPKWSKIMNIIDFQSIELAEITDEQSASICGGRNPRCNRTGLSIDEWFKYGCNVRRLSKSGRKR
jgi:hypothetical protein